MNKWKIWTAFLTVFATGIIVGVLGVGLVMQHHFKPPRDHAAFLKTMRQRFLEDITEKVQPDLSAIPAIKVALDETIDELDSIRNETHPKIKAVLEKGRERIKAHLTPEQTKRLDQMIQDRRSGKFSFFRLPPRPPMP